jgi:hypothetical protein
MSNILQNVDPIGLFFLVVIARVARWFVFKPKNPNLGKFGGPWNGK